MAPQALVFVGDAKGRDDNFDKLIGKWRLQVTNLSDATTGECAEMCYRPRSKPSFKGDIQHDLRDWMLDEYAETMSLWAGQVADHYILAARTLGMEADPVADCLMSEVRFDARTLWVAHGYMAAFWRRVRLPVELADRDPWAEVGGQIVLRRSYRGLLLLYRDWIRYQTDLWPKHFPRLLRRFALVLVQQNTVGGIEAEMDLFDELRLIYSMSRDR